MLYGCWTEHLREVVYKAAGTKRADAWKMVDISANVFRSAMAQVSVQYDRRPFVLHTDPAGGQLAARVAEARLWDRMRRVQRDTLGMREGLIRVDVATKPTALRAAGPRLQFRQVFADLVSASTSPWEPDRPTQLREAIQRTDPATGDTVWTWEEWDVRPGQEPSVRVVAADMRTDISARYLRRADGSPAPEGGLRGKEFGWRDPSGAPFAPYVVHHAEIASELWDPYEGRELVAGALNIALMWSFWGHIVRNAAWRQRYGIGVRPQSAPGVKGEGDAARSVITGDPATIWMFEADGDTGQAMLGTLEQSADPQAVADAILLYERRIAAFAGISPSDVQRVAGDPRSGFALAISRDGLREAQARYEATFRAGDLEVLAMSSALLSAAGGGNYPMLGYSIEYQTLPRTTEELRAEQEVILAQLDRGLLDKVTAYQRINPGTSQAEASAELTRIEVVNGVFAGVRPDLASAIASSLVQITAAVSAGEIPGLSARAILEHSFGLSAQAAAAVITSAEDQAALRSTLPVAPTQAPAPPGA